MVGSSARVLSQQYELMTKCIYMKYQQQLKSSPDKRVQTVRVLDLHTEAILWVANHAQVWSHAAAHSKRKTISPQNFTLLLGLSARCAGRRRHIASLAAPPPMQSHDDALARSLLPMCIDSHCHLHDDKTAHSSLSRSLETARVCLMSVTAADMLTVQRLAAGAPSRLIPAYGVHPWFAHRHANNIAEWTCFMRSAL